MAAVDLQRPAFHARTIFRLLGTNSPDSKMVPNKVVGSICQTSRSSSSRGNCMRMLASQVVEASYDIAIQVSLLHQSLQPFPRLVRIVFLAHFVDQNPLSLAYNAICIISTRKCW